MIRRLRSDDGGFTLVELVITIVIMGVITLPIANFVIAYFGNLTQTQARLSGSHDRQIAAAYFSQDVADVGLRAATSPYAPRQSVWTSPTGAYCGSTLGATVLLLQWDDWAVSTSGGNNTGSDTVHSAAYVMRSGALHRIYCASGSTVSSDATLIHNYASGGVACSTTCVGASPPATITLTATLAAAGDSQQIVLTGQRRQSS
ncbi:MAG TPA: prepilin-type N-terminal cleavage/methylation domain-containing protein [Jatrophihabitantaceae bacterium]|jgi:prepilin-type N-terminal cleavage/methylation domain-containing protein